MILYLLFSFIFSVAEVEAEPQTSKDIEIYIATNGVHTDLIVPVKNLLMDWSKKVKFENTLAKDTTFRFLSLGWGDKGFYLYAQTWKDLSLKIAFKAIAGLGSTAVHASFYKNIKESKHCVKIVLSNAQYLRLVDFVIHSFQFDLNGHFVAIATTPYNSNDAFYEATGHYSLFKTCNTWANNGLKACGQKACVWTPFDKGIFYHYIK